MERKNFKFEIKEVDEEAGVIEGYAATFSKTPDWYGDVIEEGAFSKTLQENGGTAVSLFNHNPNEPIGLAEVSQDKKGLFAKIKLVMEVPKAKEVLALAKAGVIKRMSIGYDTVKSDMVSGIRHLKELTLYDASPVIFAANQEAVITGVKSIDDIDQFIQTIQAEIKSGRVLSAANLTKVKDAIQALEALLAASESQEEPDKSTPLEDDQALEAAEIKGAIALLKGESDLDVKEAEQRIEAALELIK